MGLNLANFVKLLESEHPDELVRVTKPVNPAKFEVTALLRHLEKQGRFPAVLFDQPLNLKGEISRFRLVTNVFGTREKSAIALGHPAGDSNFGLSLAYSARLNQRGVPQIIEPSEAPVKEVVCKGAEVDLRELPIVRHHEMDPAPYIDMATCHRDLEGGFYNLAFQRTMYKGPSKLGLYMAPRHNWQICRKYFARNEAAPVIIIMSHHPAFYLGALNVQPFGVDDYEVVSGVMQEPLRLVPSATWGAEFMIPADADVVIEGEVLPGVKEPEAPFGEWPGYYGPQRMSNVIQVRAINHRRDAICQDIFVSHREGWLLGGIPKEGDVYNAIKGVVPTVKAVHFAVSGNCRLNCYISIDQNVEGQGRQAALMAMASCDFAKNVIVVDSDVDPFNEQEVMWAVATRCQPDRDLDILRSVRSTPLDPSMMNDHSSSKLIIDATRPVNRPFPSRSNVPDHALQSVKLEDYIDDEVLNRIPQHLDSIRSA
ncbi:MAG: UbiD family decarboxylase [Dehalococcoidia bacterium]|nr:UbiD family decarboxylase [Dehalococcoidia bacterium]